MAQGKSLELFFVEGKPDGMRTAEVFNWTGHVLMTPRLTLKAALERPFSQHTGVYVLIGEKDGVETAYIGESEELAPRLRSHAKEKDWWTHAVLVCTTADTLNKAHVKYLESRLVEIAHSVGAMTLENGNTPTKSSLHEAGRANMEEFLETLQIAMPALGVDMFTQKARKASKVGDAPTPTEADIFDISSVRTGVSAKAIVEGSDFVVLAGSKIRTEWVGTKNHDHNYRVLRAKLVENKIIDIVDEETVFTQDYVFSSPSAAAAVVTGRASNGRTEWKHMQSGLTYGDWEEKELKEAYKLI